MGPLWNELWMIAVDMSFSYDSDVAKEEPGSSSQPVGNQGRFKEEKGNGKFLKMRTNDVEAEFIG